MEAISKYLRGPSRAWAWVARVCRAFRRWLVPSEE